jgi:hypothetical protein
VHRGHRLGGQVDGEGRIAGGAVTVELERLVVELGRLVDAAQLAPGRVLGPSELDPLAVGVGVVCVDAADAGPCSPGRETAQDDREAALLRRRGRRSLAAAGTAWL